jgi:serine protease Do
MPAKKVTDRNFFMNVFKNIALVLSLSAPLIACSRTEANGAKQNEPSAALVDSLNQTITSSRRNAITSAIAKVSPAVVGINVIETREQRIYDPFGSFMDDPFFRQFFGRNQSGPQTRKYDVKSLGSGFFISADGYILTNDHVAGNASRVTITTTQGKEYEAQLIGTDPIADVALLKIDIDNAPYLQLGNSDDVIVGEWAIALGNPFGLFEKNDKPTVTVGVISNTDVNLGIQEGKSYRGMIQTDAAISSGNSGGPLVNANGEVIGINATIYSTAQGYMGAGSIGLGFAIPVNKVKTIVDQLKSGKRLNRNYANLGFEGRELSDELKPYVSTNAEAGVVVTAVYRRTLAEKIGLQPGDLILSVNDEKVRTFDDILGIIGEHAVGEEIILKVARNEGIATVRFKIPEAR